MRLFKNKYANLKEDILNCLGKDLSSEELITFKKEYSISCIDKYGDRYFDCKNDFISFQNRNQRKQLINEFHIKNNDLWLPFKLYSNVKLEDVVGILGIPDIIDYDFNIFKYYDLLIMISFEDVLNPNSKFKRITFTNSLKNKPSENELFDENEYWKKKINKPTNVNFGFNSKWIVFETGKIDDVLRRFKIDEKETANWKEAFEIGGFRGNGIFVFKAFNYIIVNGWSLPAIETKTSFYEELSEEFGDVFYFENHIKTPFCWVKLKAGKIERAFKDEYFENVLNVGSETDIEINLRIRTKAEQLKRIGEKYNSDQEIKKDYRKFMSEMVLEISNNWCLNPINIKIKDVNEKVFINSNYRQQWL